MRQSYHGRLSDMVAAKEAQLHAILALSHAVTHGGNSTSNLSRCTHASDMFLDQRRIFGIGLMR